MAQVRFKRPFWDGERRYPAGLQEVEVVDPEKLPSDCEIIGEDSKSEKDEFVPKLFTACRKAFTSKASDGEVGRDDVVLKAVTEFVAEEDGRAEEAWNELEEAERRSRIEKAARQLLGEDDTIE